MTETTYTRREKAAGWIIGVIGLLGLVLNILYGPALPLPESAVFLMFSMLICRLIGLKRTCGTLLVIVSLITSTALWENFQLTALVLAVGVFLNGLVITVNKGMPVENRIEPRGIHIPADDKTKFYYLCDLAVLGRWSIGDLLIMAGLWVNFVSPTVPS